jgi:anti-anti-sigma factor
LRESIRISYPAPRVAVVSLVGEHDLGDYVPLKVAFAKATTRAVNVVADLSLSAFIDSTVVSMLLLAQSLTLQDGGRLAVVLPDEPNPVTRTADLLNLPDLMPTYPTIEEALASFPHASRADLRHTTIEPGDTAADSVRTS